MAERVRTLTDRSWGQQKRPWIVIVDGQRLLNSTGTPRRFATEPAARSAGVKSLSAGLAGAVKPHQENQR